MSVARRTCSAPKCARVYYAKDYCQTHYLRLKAGTDLNRPIIAVEHHGLQDVPAYKSWHMMHQRCRNKNYSSYKNYGARGISICKRWYSFTNFYEDMGDRPDLSYSLDRIDVNGNYEPNNCRWATKQVQCINKRKKQGCTSDEPNVYWHEVTKKWAVRVTRNYRTKYVGVYRTVEEAVKARDGYLSHISLEL